jgi:predicted enzyme related to lactoylglutathione lyase
VRGSTWHGTTLNTNGARTDWIHAPQAQLQVIESKAVVVHALGLRQLFVLFIALRAGFSLTFLAKVRYAHLSTATLERGIQMPEMKMYAHGQFSWADLQTPAVNDSKLFYSKLFGWDMRDVPLPAPMNGAYTTCTLHGKSVAGMGPQPPMMEGMPALWSCYVNVDNADAIAARVVEHGGKVVVPPMDVMTEGRMFVLQDPSGAMLGCWQPNTHTGAQIVREPSALCWFEMMTRDVPAAKTFLEAVFGWTFKVSAGATAAGMHYMEILVGGNAIGGIMEMPKMVPATVPANWLPYFAVADVAAICAKAKELGGKVIMGPHELPKVGTIAVIADPQGGTFDVIAPSS